MATALGFLVVKPLFLSSHFRKPFYISFSSLPSSQFGTPKLPIRRSLSVKATTDPPGEARENEIVDSYVLPYCSRDKKQKKTVGEMEQEFLQALQAFYYEGKSVMSNEEFDNLKEELMWEGSSVVMLSPDERRFLEASMAYASGKPILSEKEFDELKQKLKQSHSVTLGNKKQERGYGELYPTDELVKNDTFPPLVSALKASAEENAASFHFPGHNRGQAAPLSLTRLIGERPFLHDLPELSELEGPILEAQKEAAEVFGASETWFLVGGSTCGVQAAVMATCLPGDVLILPRNSHISAISAMVLTSVEPKYIVPEYDSEWDIAGGITPSQVEEAIKELQTEGLRAAAVLVVSPSYHGICSDIGAISELCHKNKIPVIVDEAHGAHFGFHKQLPTSALAQGADVVVQSTHKVLCSLTQSSMLHLSSNLVDRERICRCLQLLQSSSPSYLLLASLDAATAQLSDNRGSIFNRAIELAVETTSMIKEIPGISLFDTRNFPKFPAIDPLRLTVGTCQLGLSGFEADDILCREYGVVSELVGTQSFTLAFNLGTKREHALRLVSGLKHLSATFSSEKREISIMDLAPFHDEFNMIMSPRDAFFARKRKVRFEESLGRTCGELICPYPPGIPVLIPGEVITERALNYLLHVKSKGATITGAADCLLSSLLVCM